MAEWFLILALYIGREGAPASVPMQSLDACLTARTEVIKRLGPRSFSPATFCINSKTGEIQPSQAGAR